MLINKDYFIGEINVPNVNSLPILELLNSYIQKYEVEYLTLVLGDELYNVFVTGAQVKPLDGKWNRLLYGHTYTVDDVVKRWDGLIMKGQRESLTLEDDVIVKTEVEDTDARKSPIALYVYYWFMRQAFTLTTGIGEKIPKGENSTDSGPGFKMSHAWNQMVNYTWSLYDFLNAFPNDYPEWYGSPYQKYSRYFRPINTMGI